MDKFKLDELKFPCHWNENLICEKGQLCATCEHQPDDNEKPNGKKKPVPIGWQQDYDGGIYPECPACGEMPYSLDRCFFCGQRFIKDDRTREWEKPPEIVTLDCFMCGGKGTLKGTRARSNGHFHGKCEQCGCVVHE